MGFQYYKDYSNSRETDNLFGEKKQSYTVILHLIVLKKCKKLDYLSYQIEFSHVLYLALYLTTNATQALVRELSANFINEK